MQSAISSALHPPIQSALSRNSSRLRRYFSFRNITTDASQTPTTAHLICGTSQNGFMVFAGQTVFAEPYFDVFIKRGSREVQTIRLYKSQSRFIRTNPGEVVSLGTSVARQLMICPSFLPETLPTVSGVTGTVNCDRAGEPIWNPTAPHIILQEGSRAFSITGDTLDRIIFIKEYDGLVWSPSRFYWLPAGTTINIVCCQRQIAVANFDGVPLSVTAPAGSTIGGISRGMNLNFPPITGTTRNVSTVAQLKTAIAAAIKGDEIVLAAGTYDLDVDIGHASFTSNSGRSHGILIRGATGNRDDVIIRATTNGTTNFGNWNITSVSILDADCSGFKDLTFNWNALPVSITTRGGIWKFQNVRFTNTGVEDCYNGIMDTGRRLLVDFLDCSADNSGADCWNFNGLLGDAEVPACRIRMINCIGHTAGVGGANQCVTTHSTMNIELWGGYYYNADTNVLAPDAGVIQHVYFSKVEKGARNAGIRGTNLYGCLLTGSGDITRLNYAMFNRAVTSSFRHANISAEGNFQFEILNNHMTGTAGRGAFFSIGDTTGNLKTTIAGNVIKGYATNNIIVGFYSSGSLTEVKVWNNTTSGGNVELKDQIAINAKNNAASNFSGLSATTNLDSNYNTAAAYASYSVRANDLTGALGMDSRDFPNASGNLDRNGIDIYNYVGGSDWQGFPFIYEKNVVSRGARSRPLITTNTIIFPDAY